VLQFRTIPWTDRSNTYEHSKSWTDPYSRNRLSSARHADPEWAQGLGSGLR